MSRAPGRSAASATSDLSQLSLLRARTSRLLFHSGVCASYATPGPGEPAAPRRHGFHGIHTYANH